VIRCYVGCAAGDKCFTNVSLSCKLRAHEIYLPEL
jgi:hypothetical protein